MLAVTAQLTARDKKERERLKVVVARCTKLIEEQSKMPPFTVKVLERHPFLSELQRMSTVADVAIGDETRRCALVKGSPEALKPLLRSVPEQYDAAYASLAAEGIRVLALASKQTQGEGLPRETLEAGLDFCGFVAFRCLLRSDSRLVIRALRNAVSTVMCTGDAPRTAAWVAEAVALVSKPLLHLTVGADGAPAWEPPATGTIPQLAEKYDLLATETAWRALCDRDPSCAAHVAKISVWARCTPQGKASLIGELNALGARTCFCGDGGNDVGALKKAHVGVALLNGFGNANTATLEKAKEGDAREADAEAELDKLEAKRTKAAKDAQAKAQEKMGREQKVVAAKTTARMQQYMQTQGKDPEEMSIAESIGAARNAAMLQLGETVQEVRKEQVHYDSWVSRRAAAYCAANEDQADMDPDASLWKDIQEATPPSVRLGDASVAAPFTHGMPSIACVLQIVRQGRCCVLAAVQQAQIMILSCLLNVFVLTLLTLRGVKQSEVQMVSGAAAMALAAFSFAFTAPGPRLPAVAPLQARRPAAASTLLQMAVHLAVMWAAVQYVDRELGPAGYERLHGAQRAALVAAEVPLATYSTHLKYEEGNTFWDRIGDYIPDIVEALGIVRMLKGTTYVPNLLTTVSFVLSSGQLCVMLLVNYKGGPWMRGLTENHALLGVVLAILAVQSMLLFGDVHLQEQVARAIDCVPLTMELKAALGTALSASAIGSFMVDRWLCVALAPAVAAAQARAMARGTKQLAQQLTPHNIMMIGLVVFLVVKGGPMAGVSLSMLAVRYLATNVLGLDDLASGMKERLQEEIEEREKEAALDVDKGAGPRRKKQA